MAFLYNASRKVWIGKNGFQFRIRLAIIRTQLTILLLKVNVLSLSLPTLSQLQYKNIYNSMYIIMRKVKMADPWHFYVRLSYLTYKYYILNRGCPFALPVSSLHYFVPLHFPFSQFLTLNFWWSRNNDDTKGSVACKSFMRATLSKFTLVVDSWRVFLPLYTLFLSIVLALVP